jgi:hypothetical protein
MPLVNHGKSRGRFLESNRPKSQAQHGFHGFQKPLNFCMFSGVSVVFGRVREKAFFPSMAGFPWAAKTRFLQSKTDFLHAKKEK